MPFFKMKKRLGSSCDYRILHQNFIQLIKAYSITMNPIPHPEITHNNVDSGDKATQENHQPHLQSIVDARIGVAAVKSEGMENINKNAYKGGKKQELKHKGSACNQLSKIGFIALTVLEFMLLLSLMLIQYITCQIQPLIFFITIVFLLLLHIVLTAVASRITIISRSTMQRKLPQKINLKNTPQDNYPQNDIRTKPKINQKNRQRTNAKTKKLRKLAQSLQEGQSSELTLKTGLQLRHSQEEDSFNVKKNLLLIFTPIQILMQAVLPSVSLALFYPRIKYQQYLLTLSIMAYILTPCSVVAFCLFLRDIRKTIHPCLINEQHSERQREDGVEDAHPITRISIEQMLQAKTSDIMSINMEKDPNSLNYAQPEPSPKEKSEQQEPPSIRRQEIKRSVLKSSKTHELQGRKTSEVDGCERRRVDFNSQKIQYFEYSEITPSHSMTEQQSPKLKLPEKMMWYGQRLKYGRKRMESEAQILKNKIMVRENKAKSSVELGNQRSGSQQEAVSPKNDQFY